MTRMLLPFPNDLGIPFAPRVDALARLKTGYHPGANLFPAKKCMAVERFIDTNTLLYGYDLDCSSQKGHRTGSD